MNDKLEYYLNILNLNQNKEYVVEYKIGRSCYLIIDRLTSEKKVIKFEPEAVGILHVIWRYIFSGSLPFQNELRIVSDNCYLNDFNPQTLGVTKFNNVSFYVMNYIKDVEPLELAKINKPVKERIGGLLYDIYTLDRPEEWHFLKEQVFRLLESPSRRIVSQAIKASKKHPIRLGKFISFILTNKMNDLFMVKNILPGFIHNDMGFNNLLIESSSKMYVIDWEDALWEKNWPLVDITDIALDIESGQFDRVIIMRFLEEILDKNTHVTMSEIMRHLSFGYLRSLLRIINVDKVEETTNKRLVEKVNRLLHYKTICKTGKVNNLICKDLEKIIYRRL